jgi:hypothetical protein
MSFTAKSVILDIADNHGHASNIGIRVIQFFLAGVQVGQTNGVDFNGYATTFSGTGYEGWRAFDDALTTTGGAFSQVWQSSAATSQRIVLKRLVSSFEFDEIRVVNFHDSGGSTTKGAQNAKIHISTDDITSVVPDEAIANSTLIYDGVFAEHPATNTESAETLTLISAAAGDNYRNLTNIACSDKQEMVARIRDFICKRNGTYDYSTTGIGWALFDSFYAVDEDNMQLNDWFVMYSPGESGDLDLYMHCKWIGTYLTIKIYQAWDPATNTGSTNKCGTTNNFNILETTDPSNPLWIYGDLDKIFMLLENLTTYGNGYIGGYVAPVYEVLKEDVVTVAGAVSAGTNVSIDLGTIPANWIVGRDIYLRTTHTNDNSTVKLEKARIKSIVGTAIVVDLVNAYTANFKVCDTIGIIGSNNTQAFAAMLCMISPDGDLSYAVTWAITTGLPLTTYDPESFSDFIGLYKLYWTTTKGALGVIEDIVFTPIQNAAFTHKDIIQEPDGTNWRCFKLYSNLYMAVREV